MSLKTKINRFKHKTYVSCLGALGDKSISKLTRVPSFGIVSKITKKYDRNEAHKIAIKKSYSRMKRNPNLTPGQLSDAYYKDRTKALNEVGILRGGIILQYLNKKHK